MSGPTPVVNDEIVRAGAGAGKTTTLVARVIDLILHYRSTHQRWPRLVVTTFTRKATQELRERLTIEACERDDLELLDYCRSRTMLHISTIHGVLGLFLRRYGHLMGVDPSFTFLSETGARQVRRTVLRQMLIEEPHAAELLEAFPLARLESLLHSYSEAAVLHPTMQPQSESVIRAEQNEVLQALSEQTGRIAAEILSRAQGERWRQYGEFLQAVARHLGEAHHPQGWQRLQDLQALWPNKPALTKSETRLDTLLDEQIKELNHELDQVLSDPGWSPEAAEALARLGNSFSTIAAQYDQRLLTAKLAQSTLEMSDLELLSARLLRQHPAVAEIFSEDWDHWLVDEFQDTSPLQIELLKCLIGPKPHFVVGDPQQSIYLFRGARVEIFARHEAELQSRGVAAQFRLKNYRSHPSLLVFLNDFFATLSADFQAMEPKSENFEPERVVACFHVAPEVDKIGGREAEYEALRAHIQTLLAQGNVELSDICILGRKNDHLLKIAQHLKAHGIPTHVHASRGYFQRREVRDALAILKFLVHPHDNKNLVHILRSPWARVADQDLVRAFQAKGPSFWEQLRASELNGHPVIQDLERFRLEVESQGFSRTWERALVHLGLFDFSHHHDATGRCEANLWKLLGTFHQFERQPGFKVLDFISNSQTTVVDTESADEGDAVTAVEPNVVNLMTIHAAKGLQRQHILLPHCDEPPPRPRTPDLACAEGVWSVTIPWGDEEKWIYSPLAKRLAREQRERELKEHDRLLYVALTRAQESVFISWSGRAKAESWAARWRWPVTECGQFQSTHYTTQVRQGRVDEVPPYRALHTQSVIRDSWEQVSERAAEPASLSLSVVDLLEGERVPTRRRASEDTVVHDVARAIFGTQVHRLLELRQFDAQGSWRQLAREWFGERNAEVIQAVEWVEALSEPPMATLLTKAQAEWGFQVRTNAGILEGQIDLWGEENGRIWLLDYKSGDPAYVEKAFAQLEIYAYALRRFGHRLPIELVVIYPFERQVHRREMGRLQDLLERFPQLNFRPLGCQAVFPDAKRPEIQPGTFRD